MKISERFFHAMIVLDRLLSFHGIVIGFEVPYLSSSLNRLIESGNSAVYSFRLQFISCKTFIELHIICQIPSFFLILFCLR